MKLLSRVWRYFIPNVVEYPEDHPRVQGFVFRLQMRARFVFIHEIVGDFVKVNVRVLLPTDEMWEWVDASPERIEWLIQSLSHRFEMEGSDSIKLSIDNEGRIGRRL